MNLTMHGYTSKSSPKPTLLIDCRWIRYSGVGTCIHNIVQEIYARNCVDCTLICLNSDKDIVSEFPFSVNVIWTNIKSMTLSEQFILPFKLRGNFDFFYSPVYIKPIFHPGKLICTIHDILHVSKPNFTRSRFFSLYAFVLIAIALVRSKLILVDTKFTRDEICRFFPWVKKSRLKVLYPGFKNIVSGNLASQNTSQNSAKITKPYFLFVGNLKPHKNLKVLIRAYLNSHSRKTHELRVVGKSDGLMTSSISTHIDDACGYDSIIFEGQVDESYLSQLYNQTTALVFPSYYEGFGLPPLEALSIGTCVISSSAPPMPEVIGDNALFFDPDDADTLTSLLDYTANNESLLQSKSNKNKTIQWLQDRYSWSKYVDTIISFVHN